MVRKLIKSGNRIQLIPPPSEDDGEDGKSCPGCLEEFDTSDNRRCSYSQCDHIYCLKCVKASTIGCGQCGGGGGGDGGGNIFDLSSIKLEVVDDDGEVIDPVEWNHSDVCLNLNLDLASSGNGELQLEVEEEEVNVDGESLLEEESVEGSEGTEDEKVVNGGRGVEVRRSSRKRRLSQSLKENDSEFSKRALTKWTCSYCGLACLDKNYLGKHMRQEHGDKRPYNCDICDWCLVSQKLLDAHRKAHENERPFQCPMCPIKFTRKFTLQRHIYATHRDKVCTMPHSTHSRRAGDSWCPTCSTEFEYSKVSLRRKSKYLECEHISCIDCIISSTNGCAQCLEAKTVTTVPKKIDKIQSPSSSSSNGSSKISVDLLKKKAKLSMKSALNLKLLEKENQDLESDSGEDSSYFQQTDRQCQCAICDANFSRMYSLERHVERAHKNIVQILPQARKGSRCPSCQELFDSVKHGRHRKTKYLRCEHFACLGCVIKENLQCGQCSQSATSSQQSIISNGHSYPYSLDINSSQDDDEEKDATWTPDSPEQKKKKNKVVIKANGVQQSSAGSGAEFQCRICSHKFTRHHSFQRHLTQMHNIHVITPEEEDKAKTNEDEDKYCPECQEEFGSTKDNPKTVYTSCGHMICLQCIWKAELGCGQCTTEQNAFKWDQNSPSMSPTKSEVFFRKSSLASKQPKKIPSASVSPAPSSSSMFSPETEIKVKRGRGRPRKIRPPENQEDLTQGSQSSQEKSSQENYSPDSSFSSFSSPNPSPSISLRPRISLISTRSNGESSAVTADEKVQNRRASVRDKRVLNSGTISKDRKSMSPLKKKILVQQKAREALQFKEVLNSNGIIYKCIHCGKTFPNKRSKSIHCQLKHASERRFTCKYCNWRCLSNNDLQRHVLKHTKEKPYKCTICTRAFTRIYTLRTHYIQRHPETRIDF